MIAKAGKKTSLLPKEWEKKKTKYPLNCAFLYLYSVRQVGGDLKLSKRALGHVKPKIGCWREDKYGKN